MKKLIVFLILFTIGCSNKEVLEPLPKVNKDDKLILEDSLNFEYGKKYYLYDLVKNDELIKDENILLDTNELGEKKVTINNEEITYNVVDTTPPVIQAKSLTNVINTELDILSKVMFGDNYDRHVKGEIIGEYDLTKLGTYQITIKATDSSGNVNEKKINLTIIEKKASSSKKNYYFNDLIAKYKTDKTTFGIDVSSWQENIDWETVKKAGCDFAMIRIGFGHNKDNKIIFDNKFERNLKNAKKAGVKVGLYFYSYAKTKEDAITQAKWVIEALDGEKLDLPIAFDWEIWTGFQNYNMNFKDLNDVATAFIDEINKAGYEGVIYSSAYFLNRIWDLDSRTWLAYYTDNNDFEKDFFMWQVSGNGRIDGIKGAVDLDILYAK